jgi:hypothetical protein
VPSPVDETLCGGTHPPAGGGAEAVELTAVHHFYTYAQLVALLTDAGFGDVKLCGGPDGRRYS